ncbi:MbtH family NRPS accessory protein [Streptomyces seoulensis]
MSGRRAPEDTARHDCLVLVNALGRLSLWPAELETPLGWPIAYGPTDRARCLGFIDRAPIRRPAAATAA